MNKQIITAIIIGALIVSGGLIISQSMKQNSIERQQTAKIEAEKELKKAEELNELYRQVDLSDCIGQADIEYWDYMRLNGTKKDNGIIWAQNSIWDRAEKNKQTAIDNCYRRFK